MDRELIEYLQAMEQRMNTRIDSLENRIHANTELLTSVSESLQREMHAGFEQLAARMDLMERRLDRHGSLLQTGARWTARMATWSERVDKGDSQREIRISNMENRVRKMEEGRPPAANEGQ